MPNYIIVIHYEINVIAEFELYVIYRKVFISFFKFSPDNNEIKTILLNPH
jgi:hypothetical protein